ncbi:MAG: glycosyltransferase family 4 protein, partial [Anaerolineales bacterium]
MRALHLIDHDGLGGAQRIIQGILRHRPQDQVLPLRHKLPQMFSSINGENLGICQGSLMNYPVSIWRLFKKLRSGEVDILHCHLQAAFIVGALMQPYCKRKKIPLVFHEHNPYATSSIWYRALVRHAARIGHVIAVSPFIYHTLSTSGVPVERLTLLPNFIDLRAGDINNTSPALREPQGVKGIIGMAARFVPEKGWEYAFQAIDKLRDAGVELWIAGVGKDLARAKRWVFDHNLQAQIRFLGVVEDMPQFYRSLDVLIHPALHEPFGLVPLEAQAYGVPVILFEYPGSRDIFTERSVVFCPPGDVNALVIAIRSVLQEEKVRQALIQNGYKNVERYRPTPYFEALENFYTT